MLSGSKQTLFANAISLLMETVCARPLSICYMPLACLSCQPAMLHPVHCLFGRPAHFHALRADFDVGFRTLAEATVPRQCIADQHVWKGSII